MNGNRECYQGVIVSNNCFMMQFSCDEPRNFHNNDDRFYTDDIFFITKFNSGHTYTYYPIMFANMTSDAGCSFRKYISTIQVLNSSSFIINITNPYDEPGGYVTFEDYIKINWLALGCC